VYCFRFTSRCATGLMQTNAATLVLHTVCVHNLYALQLHEHGVTWLVRLGVLHRLIGNGRNLDCYSSAAIDQAVNRIACVISEHCRGLSYCSMRPASLSTNRRLYFRLSAIHTSSLALSTTASSASDINPLTPTVAIWIQL